MINHIKKTGVSLLLLFAFTFSAAAKVAVWQWSVLVKNTKQNNGEVRAYLWIPPACKTVRGVVFAQNNMEEQSILENSKFRAALADIGFAEVWVSPAFDLFFNFEQGAGETFNGLMNDLAEDSGYTELRFAPFIGLGHSAAASAPYYMAVWNPQRAIAALSVSGQWPYVRNQFAPDIWKESAIDYIPSLETMGEYEAAATWAEEGLKERQSHPLMPLSMLSGPAQSHFYAAQEKIDFLAFYIKKAVKYRLPGNTPPGETPTLLKVDPTKMGWLAERWRLNKAPENAAAPVQKYKGDPAQAFWYFDEETVRYVETYQSGHRNKKAQLIGFVQDGKEVPQREVHQQINLRFEPEADGVTFKLHAKFDDTVGSGSSRLQMWTGLPVGSSIGHAKLGGPVHIERITGPVEKINDSTFRVHPQLGFWQQAHSYELWFAATHPGDQDYKPALQQAEMLVPPRNITGKEQHIRFEEIPDQKPGKKGIELKAISDAGVPVGFYIQDGPAEIVGNHINLTAIPPRARYPVKVTVIAWQYGNSNEPKLQTAEQVKRTFLINK